MIEPTLPDGTEIVRKYSVPEQFRLMGFKDGERRVKDVYVLEGDIYVPLDPNKTYTVGGTNYVLLNSGDGNTIFKDCKAIIENGITDVEALYHYLKDRGGFKEDYSKLEGRLIVK